MSSSNRRRRHKRAKPRSDSFIRERDLEIQLALEDQRRSQRAIGSAVTPVVQNPPLRGYEYDAATDRYYKVAVVKANGYKNGDNKYDNCTRDYSKRKTISKQIASSDDSKCDLLTSYLVGRERGQKSSSSYSFLSSHYLRAHAAPTILSPNYIYYMRGPVSGPPSVLAAQPFEEGFQPCHFTDSSYHYRHGLIYSSFEHQDIFLYNKANNTSRLVHSNRSDVGDLFLDVPSAAAHCQTKVLASISKLNWLSSGRDDDPPMIAYVGEVAGRGCMLALQSCDFSGRGWKAAQGCSGWIETFEMCCESNLLTYSCRDEVYKISVDRFAACGSNSSNSGGTNRLDVFHKPHNRVYRCPSKFNTVMEIESNRTLGIEIYAQRNGEVVACDDRVNSGRENNIAAPLIARMKYCVDYMKCLHYSPSNIIISDINNRIETYDLRYMMKSTDSKSSIPVNVISAGSFTNSIRKKRFFVDSKEAYLVTSLANNKLHIYHIKSSIPALIDCKELTDIAERWHGENYTVKFPSYHRGGCSDDEPFFASSSYTFSNGSIYESNMITMDLP